MKQTVLNPVLSDRRGPCLVLILNVPAKRNILSPEVYEGLHRGLDAALADPEIANVILTGAGGFFCAGGDLNALATRCIGWCGGSGVSPGR